MPSGCDTDAAIHEINSHGADFVFLGLSDPNDKLKVAKNTYDIPIFTSEKLNEKDPF